MTVVGNAVGEYVLADAFGLGTLVQHSVVAFTVLKMSERCTWVFRPFGIAGR
ncbi:hypothetical protein [Halosaccharopolyspora lacisalsi]|uniref:hypothetical protein n=1 Tax=Halosaccharopolyspora lacisalsi TaxID=1000566 RepID=UPI001F40E857|nr:hypothetical protein [Halosaccharopolyspora lacisalsi]